MHARHLIQEQHYKPVIISLKKYLKCLLDQADATLVFAEHESLEHIFAPVWLQV